MQIKNLSTSSLLSLLDNYQKILLEENSVLSESTKLLGNDKWLSFRKFRYRGFHEKGALSYLGAQG